ncbi:MAG: zf-HC2 domain-containing protein [Woeseiaceae bacterium]|nr:zf-HC2 domain-containing protein [Woeseiaceae bacterium]
MKQLMRRLKGTMLRRMHGMITCREFEEFVLRYLNDELEPKQKKRFEWHLRICRECREYLAAYKRTVEIGKAVLGREDDSVPDDVPEDLIKAVLDSRNA